MGRELGLGEALPALLVLPRLQTPGPHPAILLAAELVPLFSLSRWPVKGGPCFSEASGCGVISEEAGDAGPAGSSLFLVSYNLEPLFHPWPHSPSGLHFPGRAGSLPCPVPSPACPTNFLPLCFAYSPCLALLLGSPRPWAEELG